MGVGTDQMELVVGDMKANSKVFKGIEYVQISELPLDQRTILSSSVNKNIIIKILVGGKVLNDCIQFKDYVKWYEGIFKQQKSVVELENSMTSSLPELAEKKS